MPHSRLRNWLFLSADQFAAAGYLTVVPNFRGIWNDAPPLKDGKDDRKAAKTNQLTQDERNKTILDALKYLKKAGITSIRAVGFCAGAPYVIEFLTNHHTVILAGFVAHPASFNPARYEKIVRPLSVIVGTLDNLATQPVRIQMENALIKSEVPFQINVFSSVDHGFAVRRPIPAHRRTIWPKQQAFMQAVSFFEEHLFKFW